MATLITKNSSTTTSVPIPSQLVQGELAVNVTDKRLFTEDSGGSVVEVGTNPSSLTLSSGTANGVTYLNGSKVLTSGSALVFDGTNLGVGTAAPLTALHVNGTGGELLRISITSDSGTQQEPALGFATGATSTYPATKISALEFDASDSRASMLFYTRGTNSDVAPTEAMRITSAGDVGIGTTSPGDRLVAASANNIIRSLGTAGYGAFYAQGSGINASYLFFGNAGGEKGRITTNDDGAVTFSNTTSTIERMRLDSAGNLGLGVTPSAWGASGTKALQLNKSVLWNYLNLENTYLGSNYYFNGTNRIYTSTGFASEYSQGSGVHAWYTAPSGTAGNAITFTQAMTLDTSGNLLVGTTTASNNPVSGALFYNNGSGFANVIGHPSGAPNGQSYGLFCYNGTIIGQIYQSGTTAVVYSTTSDYRLKTVIGPVMDAGTRIDTLQPVEYEWKSDGSRTRGFLAHKFQEVYAGSVSGKKDDVDEDGKPKYQAMQASSSEVIADLVAEIQSLRKRLAAAGI